MNLPRIYPPRVVIRERVWAVPAIWLGEAFREQEGTPLHFPAVQLSERRLARHPVLFRTVVRGYAKK